MTLTRPQYKMPSWVRHALADKGLMVAYKARPLYQQNDYIGWITRAKRHETRVKRMNQMLHELKRGGVYMNMVWKPTKRRSY